ncbi:hypothetical protein [Actinomadura sp. 3N508]|uniref:hypothetical protein n=1 Tax=Actinomadura sp. 3N508 TaxID=3375153 RepID=UPI003790673C
MTDFALVDDDQQLHVRDGAWKPELGPEGFDRVPLHPGAGITAFVNDCGFRLPDRYPRNILGALIAIRLGAHIRPLAGPVVFTGWNPAGCGSEIRPLNPADIQSLTAIHADFTAALNGTHHNQAWAGKVLAAADQLRSMPTPTITLIGGL